MKLLILGATGMAGHTITFYMKEQGHDVTAITRKPFNYCKNILSDLHSLEAIGKTLSCDKFEAVINCVGILTQDAELNKHTAIFYNTYLPHYLCNITKDMKTKIIHMSTDCVFSGQEGSYNESSFKDGETFYDRSKSLGEIDNDKDLTFRNSIIGPDLNENGIGLFNWFMKQTDSINGYNQTIWTGVTALTLAKAMEKAIIDNLCGLYHLVNNLKISKYDLLQLFNKYFKNNSIQINKDSSVKTNKSLINNRKDFSFTVPPYEEMIREMKEWIYQHKYLYPHYFK